MHLTTIDEIKDYSNFFSDGSEDLSNKEIIDLIEAHLNGEDRVTYLKVKNGTKVTKVEMTRLTTRLQEIVTDHG
jgi:thiamine biosynthesis protein ThiC